MWGSPAGSCARTAAGRLPSWKLCQNRGWEAYLLQISSPAGSCPRTAIPYTTQDGTEYQFPNGLSLAGCLEMSAEDKDRVVRLIQKHDEVFSKGSLDLGTCDKIPHKIVTSDEQPPNQPYRRIPPHHLGEVRELLHKFLHQGIIRKSTSPHASPIVLVKKKDGSLRICVDYRRLNAKTVRDSFPLPRIEESLEALRGARYLSTLDLAHAWLSSGCDG